ncbi:hypothetical protein [Ectopseudomonas oleovorans]|uniref:hypothetical protein n=1 Tax=Ectopseudomonas oleovorans TaxID=301 RepID=UPI0035B2C0FC
MIGHRTRMSLVQLLAQQDQATVETLFVKHGVALQHRGAFFHEGLRQTMQGLGADQALAILVDVMGSRNDLRHGVSPKTRFDERFGDLERCLLLDGYELRVGTLLRTDPSLAEAPPIEDDLVAALLASQAPNREEIVRKIQDSAQAFRAAPPDYNASLTNARVALETLARDIAADLVPPGQLPPYDASKWGAVVAFMRASGAITVEEEKGLAGVYGFVSPGAHRFVSIAEEHMTRLGRSLALNMCWFLLNNHVGRRPAG